MEVDLSTNKKIEESGGNAGVNTSGKSGGGIDSGAIGRGGFEWGKVEIQRRMGEVNEGGVSRCE